jgi:CopG family transcriptional regulator, nickel-responsive regulator
MEQVTRFGVSVPGDLLEKFDSYIEAKKYTNRSEAIRDLIRTALAADEWQNVTGEVMGSISMVFDHHTRDLNDRISHLQHNYFKNIVSTTHVHIDAHNCLEVVIVRGKPKVIQEIADRLISARGVKLGKVALLSTGKNL